MLVKGCSKTDFSLAEILTFLLARVDEDLQFQSSTNLQEEEDV